MKWLYNSKEFIIPPLKILSNVAIPALATFVIWDALSNITQILAILLLTILIIKNLGFNVDVASRLSKTKIGKVLGFLIRNSNTITRINEEYFEETSELIAEGTINLVKQGKKFKEEIQMKKFRQESLLWLNHNKKLLLSSITLILFAFDYYFGFSKKAGMSPDIVYTLASIIFMIALWVMGGEGWTGNVINRLRANEKIAQTETEKKVKLFRKELAKLESQIKEILKFKIGDILPPNKQAEYNKLVESKTYYEGKIKEFLDTISKEEVLL